MQASLDAEARGKTDFVRTKKKLEQDINELEVALDTANRGRAEAEKNVKKFQQQIVEIHQVVWWDLCYDLLQFMTYLWFVIYLFFIYVMIYHAVNLTYCSWIYVFSCFDFTAVATLNPSHILK